MDVVDDGKSVDGKESKALVVEIVEYGNELLSFPGAIGMKEIRDWRKYLADL